MWQQRFNNLQVWNAIKWIRNRNCWSDLKMQKKNETAKYLLKKWHNQILAFWILIELS